MKRRRSRDVFHETRGMKSEISICPVIFHCLHPHVVILLFQEKIDGGIGAAQIL